LKTFRVDIQVTIVSDFRDGSDTCSLCLESIDEMLAYEIATTSPRVYKLMFHNFCYQQMFMGMLLLVDKRITDEENKNAPKLQS